MTSPVPVPPQAIAAAEHAIRARYTITGPDVDRRVKFVMGDVRAALEAAAPLLAAVERERCAQLAEKTGAIIPFRMAADNSTGYERQFAELLRKEDHHDT